MSRMGFVPTIPMFERAKTCHALDHAATVIGSSESNQLPYCNAVLLPCRTENFSAHEKIL
jgi:hypothetical protein